MSNYKSNKVEVFPSAHRTKRVNGKFTSENNFSNIIKSLLDIQTINDKLNKEDGYSDGFVVYHALTKTTNGIQSGTLSVVINGYYFEIEDVEKTSNLWLGIRVGKSSEKLLPYSSESTTDYLDGWDTEGTSESDSDFLALEYFPQRDKPTVTGTGYYFLNVYHEGVLNKLKFITDSIYYKSGDKTLTEELDSKQAKLTAGDGIELVDNKVKLTDEEYKKLSSLEETSGSSSKLIYFKDGEFKDSTSTVGGFKDSSKSVFTYTYLDNGEIVAGPKITFSKGNPSGGSAGDIWFKYSD